MEKNYVIIWNDGFTSTFYETIEDARTTLDEMICNTGVGGKIITYKEYMEN